jgi:MFS family permease
MSAALVGGTLFQVPFGRLSDRIDRRKVLILACVIAVLAGGVLALAGDVRSGGMLPEWLEALAAHPASVIGAVGVFGGCIYSMYSLCVAHTNDFVEREDFVEASSGLLLTWGLGATLGPVLAGPLMQTIGLEGLFLFAAIVHVALIVFAWYRTRQRAPLPPEARADFVQAGHTRTSHVLATLDPRAPEQAPSDAEPAPQPAPAG